MQNTDEFLRRESTKQDSPQPSRLRSAGCNLTRKRNFQEFYRIFTPGPVTNGTQSCLVSLNVLYACPSRLLGLRATSCGENDLLLSVLNQIMSRWLLPLCTLADTNPLLVLGSISYRYHGLQYLYARNGGAGSGTGRVDVLIHRCRMPCWGSSDSLRFHCERLSKPNKSEQIYCTLEGKKGFPSGRLFSSLSWPVECGGGGVWSGLPRQLGNYISLKT